MSANIQIVRYYRAKNHPEMEPFPTLKRSWLEPQMQFLHRIKELEERAYYKRGEQADATYRAYPNETAGIPEEEWPKRIRTTWNAYEKELSKIDKEVDYCYDEILRLESELFRGLDPLEFTALELRAGFEIQCRNKLKNLPQWGINSILTEAQKEDLRMNSWNFHNNGGVSNKWYPLPNIPAEFIEARYISEKEENEIANQFADKGIVWIENQERLLLGLDLLPKY